MLNYFNPENTKIICDRLRQETDIIYLPHLGYPFSFGMGDPCLEEGLKDDQIIFKFYVIDRAQKFDYVEFTNIEEAINHLVSYYEKMN